MNATAALLASVLLVAAQPAQQPNAQNVPNKRLDKFVVALIEDVQVPAREPGVLVALDAKKGQLVKKDDVLGHIDDSDAQVRKLIADSELKSAQEQAASDANLKAAEATIGVALAEYEGSRKIKERAEQAVSEFELRRLQLTHERSVYQADDRAGGICRGAATRAARRQLSCRRWRTKSRGASSRHPSTASSWTSIHNVGEWAQAGEPIYRIVQMDRLRVEGMLKADELHAGRRRRAVP